MKHLKLSVAVLAMTAMIFTGCKKDEESRYDGQIANFTLTTADMDGAKAHLGDDYYAYWDANDPVKINDGSYSVTLDNGVARLNNVPAAENYYGVYPAACVSGNAAGASTDIIFPASYTYTEYANGNQKIEAPMVAKATHTDNQLTFSCLTALWKVSVPADYTVSSITVTADNQSLAGTAAVNIETKSIADLTGDKTITLNFNTPVSTGDNGKAFIIPVPEIKAGTLVTIEVNATKNTTKDATDYTLIWCKRAKQNIAKHTILSNVNADLYTIHYTTNSSENLSSQLNTFARKNNCNVEVDGSQTNGWVATFTKPITALGNTVFSNCTYLTGVTIPSGVTSIAEAAFYNCINLQSVTIPSSVETIGRETFYQCSKLTNITIPNSVTSIESSVFFKCSKLASITIPNDVTSIGANAFCHCTSLASVTIPNRVTSIGNFAFQDCTNLTSVTIPGNVTSIGDDAFHGCTSLASVTIQDGVESIGEAAFHSTSLASVTIPRSVKTIESAAFQSCSNLLSVTCLVQSPNGINQYAFSLINENAILYVPQNTRDAYWPKFGDYFADIIEIAGE